MRVWVSLALAILDPLELFVMQGGVFSDDDFLYLINGDALTDCDGCGIHVFAATLTATGEPCSSGQGDCVARQVARSSNGQGPFNYAYNPGSVFNREEPEGITYWDLTAPGAPAVPGIATGGLPVASSQLHALMLDNDLASDDDVYVKHYQVGVSCAPEAGINVSPLSIDFGDVDLGGSALAALTISNKGLHRSARTDGATPPEDFVTGLAAAQIAAEIAELRSHLSCSP